MMLVKLAKNINIFYCNLYIYSHFIRLLSVIISNTISLKRLQKWSEQCLRSDQVFRIKYLSNRRTTCWSAVGWFIFWWKSFVQFQPERFVLFWYSSIFDQRSEPKNHENVKSEMKDHFFKRNRVNAAYLEYIVPTFSNLL